MPIFDGFGYFGVCMTCVWQFGCYAVLSVFFYFGFYFGLYFNFLDGIVKTERRPFLVKKIGNCGKLWELLKLLELWCFFSEVGFILVLAVSLVAGTLGNLMQNGKVKIFFFSLISRSYRFQITGATKSIFC